MAQTLMRGSPPDSQGYAVPSGWMDSETFVKWLKHFKEHLLSSENEKVVLLLK